MENSFKRLFISIDNIAFGISNMVVGVITFLLRFLLHNFSKIKIRKVMKPNTLKLKKFKTTRVYGFKHSTKSVNPNAFETTTPPTSGIIM